MTELAALDPHQQAIARSRLYGLLARLLVHGLDERALDQLDTLGWAPALGSTPGERLEALQVGHHASFALGVFPYAGVFLDASATAGGFADPVRAHYARAGFTPLLDDLTADHLGIELAFLSFVSGAQADALEDGRPAVAATLDRQLAGFLDECVLSWLPSFVVALEAATRSGASEVGEAGEFWARVARETLDLVAEHRSHLPGAIAPAQLLEVGDLLADEKTGLRRIVEHLLTPAACGVFTSRVDIVALGRANELPRGFGSRVLMLDNLLRSAIEYGQLAPLLTILDAQLAARDHALGELASTTALDSTVQPWRDAIDRTRSLVRRIGETASLLSPAEPQALP